MLYQKTFPSLLWILGNFCYFCSFWVCWQLSSSSQCMVSVSKPDTQLPLLESTGVRLGKKLHQMWNLLHWVSSLADAGPEIIHCPFRSLAQGFLSLYLPNYLWLCCFSDDDWADSLKPQAYNFLSVRFPPWSPLPMWLHYRYCQAVGCSSRWAVHCILPKEIIQLFAVVLSLVSYLPLTRSSVLLKAKYIFRPIWEPIFKVHFLGLLVIPSTVSVSGIQAGKLEPL